MDEQLLLRFLYKECTAEDLIQIDQWISSDEANANWFFEMEKVWTLRDELKLSDENELEVAYNRFLSSLHEKKVVRLPSPKPNLITWIGSVAAVLLIGVLLLGIYQFTNTRQQFTADNVVEVSRGQQASLTLSDGTKVWLNSGSRFSYPSQFSNKTRTVSLQGEGFFEVVHNGETPFVIDANQLKVKVLGTKFNIRSYPDESVAIILKEGKVEVSTPDDKPSIIMQPNQQIRYSKSTGMTLSKNVDIFAGEGWRFGRLMFAGCPLKEIMNAIERKFDVQVAITDPALEKESFTCNTKADASIEQIFELLKNTQRLNYSITGKRITIENNNDKDSNAYE